jgi:arsenic resistance protein ArsH
MEELLKFTLLVRDRSDYLVDRYSERKGALTAQAVSVTAGVVEIPAPQRRLTAQRPVRLLRGPNTGAC